LKENQHDTDATINTLLAVIAARESENTPSTTHDQEPQQIQLLSAGTCVASSVNTIDLASRLKLQHLKKMYSKVPGEMLESVYIFNENNLERTMKYLDEVFHRNGGDSVPSSSAASEVVTNGAPESVQESKLAAEERDVLEKMEVLDARLNSLLQESELSIQDEEATQRQQPSRIKKGDSFVTVGRRGKPQPRGPSQQALYLKERKRVQAFRDFQRRLYSLAASAHASKEFRKADMYVQKAKDVGERLQQEEQAVAKRIFTHTLQRVGDMLQVDLHGLHVKEAMSVLVDLLQVSRDTGVKLLSIITGLGHHSAGGVARIRPEVIKFVENSGLQYKEVTPGRFIVEVVK